MAVELWSEIVVPLAVGLGAAGLGHLGSSRRLRHQLEADREAQEQERVAAGEERRAARAAETASEMIPLVRELGRVLGDEDRADGLRQDLLVLTLTLPRDHQKEVQRALQAMKNAEQLAQAHYLTPTEMVGEAIAHAVVTLRRVELEQEPDERPVWMAELDELLEHGLTGVGWAEDFAEQDERRAAWLADHPEIVEALREAGHDVPDAGASDG